METKIPNSMAQRRRKKLQILPQSHDKSPPTQQNFLIEKQGNRVTQQDEIEHLLVEHFKDILSEPNINRAEDIDKISHHIPKKVTRDQNLALLRVISKDELEEAINKMAKNKAPGPDGFTIKFYQANWSFMVNDLLDLVEESRCSKRMHHGLNATFLALIPKFGCLDESLGFRPISLCNVLYKILATIIVNRLKPILPELIALVQTGFVQGRQITDGIIVSQEVIHSLKSSRAPGMLIKLDLAKAFDRLSWIYLEGILKAYGFDQQWIKWILSRVSCPVMSILLNGSPSEAFTPSRGLRQGNPLSPFFFILAADGLGRLVKAQVSKEKIKGLHIYGEDIPVSHQQFVDDIMLYGQATLKEA